jgi:hypothetical protein
MSRQQARDYWDDWGLVRLWASMLAGPAAFGLDLQAGYSLVKWACGREATFVLTLIAAACLGITLWGAAVARTSLRQTRAAAEDGGTVLDRSYFMAAVALPLNLLLALLIVLTAVPHFVLSPCE